MTKKEMVLMTLRHETPPVIPYYMELTEEEERKMIDYTGDPLFFEHTDSYLAQERNESFTDLGWHVQRYVRRCMGQRCARRRFWYCQNPSHSRSRNWKLSISRTR